jgi:hypothetical protein
MITTKEISWAAGFLEGEGCFQGAKRTYGSLQISVEAAQVQKEPLERLHKMFGGTILQKVPSKASLGNSPYYQWYIHGRRAIEVMMTVYCLMSPKRQAKIQEIIKDWKAFTYRSGPQKQTCVSGQHAWIPENISTWNYNKQKYCNKCRKVSVAKYEAKKKEQRCEN